MDMRYKKQKTFLLILSIILAFAFLGPSYGQSGALLVTIDGKGVPYTSALGYPFIDQNSRTQVPFRITLESFGAKVTWDSAHNTAIAEKDGIIVQIPIGTSYILRNTIKIQNDTKSLIQEGRTYLPIRAVIEAFGSKVSYSASTRTISIQKTADAGSIKAMTIKFISVGQGDSTFIDFGNFEILIDAGTSDYGNQVVSTIRPYIDGNLDVIVATHAHADHIGGLPAVIKAFQVGTIIDSGEVGTTLAYKNYYAAASGKANCNFITDSNMQLDMGGGSVYKILELGDGYHNTNSNSIVSLLDYKNVKVLFMGDLDSTVEETKIEVFTDVDVIKIGHHGSRTSSSTLFLDKVKPEMAIISAGVGNSYQHPHTELMARLLDRKISVFGTFRSGDITMTTNGLSYSVDASTKLTMADCGAPAIH